MFLWALLLYILFPHVPVHSLILRDAVIALFIISAFPPQHVVGRLPCELNARLLVDCCKALFLVLLSLSPARAERGWDRRKRPRFEVYY